VQPKGRVAYRVEKAIIPNEAHFWGMLKCNSLLGTSFRKEARLVWDALSVAKQPVPRYSSPKKDII